MPFGDQVLHTITGEPFATTEEAWFWACRMQVERRAGMRPDGRGSHRPCDIDDVFMAASEMVRRRRLGKIACGILVTYGLKQCPPDYRYEAGRLKAWDAMMDHLTTELRGKGIVR